MGFKKNKDSVILCKKVKIYPTKEQIANIERDSFLCKMLYNTYLTQRKEYYNCYNKSMKMTEQRSQIKLLREQNTEYAKVYAKHLHAVCMDLDEDYKGCIKKRSKGEKAKLPRYKDKNYFYPLKTPKQYIKIKEDKIKLGFYELKVDVNEIPTNYGEVWISKVRNKYIISITYEANKKENNNNNVLAIDLGISKLVTGINQNGKVIEIINPRYDKYWNKKIDKVRAMRDTKKKGSKRYKKLTRTLKRLYENRRKQQEHFIHTITKYLVLNNKELILGDLSQEQMIKKSNLAKLNRSIKENWALGKFKTFLTYKAKLHDVNIVYINEAYTSKTCSNCGNQQDMRLSKRTYTCECGMTLDRDINSSINIFNKYKENSMLNYKNINRVTTLHFHYGKLVA
ncbi:IS200/IS605 family element transposase accessory protein TnpB [Crassaminicella thermophila]|uniref:IS200/IS605 family element transposase accessory protein TnpB n=1 Tax=Crassaminicella thermophila TaxID=2599308 RepID=A0A5C0SCD0_CRATE|nr:RNA-guided endonuclease TnpB family protein [Crassaminicella thermophila]QEK11366.1 IS200/IS605 family element transposase accessory protein TnpB [Crassaminicella thermophila]